ncbi:MAG: nucleotidyltransferase domain-containing protein [Victivallales bacterium]|nr:nucleotidyltransferase domain-containing protein [Victivallales bacterium]
MALTYDTLQNDTTGRVIFRGIWGSHAFGTATPESDLDTLGVYVLEPETYLSLVEPPAQVSDEHNDNRFYSLRNFLELAANANPNILDMLYLPDDCVLKTSPYWQMLQAKRDIFCSQKVCQTYCEYAMGQIKKARGCNKRIHNPQPEEPPTPEKFCFVLATSPSGMPMRPVPLKEAGVNLERCHAAALENSGELYRLYDYGDNAHGVFRNGMLVCESIPKADETTRFIGLMVFNKNAFEQAKSKHRQYWEWRRTRNEARWRTQEAGLLDYDAKNLMHTFRLLYSAQHILEHGTPIVRFTGEKLQELRDIRAGRFSYDELVSKAVALSEKLAVLRETTQLPETADMRQIDALLLEITHKWENNHER